MYSFKFYAPYLPLGRWENELILVAEKSPGLLGEPGSKN